MIHWECLKRNVCSRECLEPTCLCISSCSNFSCYILRFSSALAKYLCPAKCKRGVHLRAVSGSTRASYFIFPQNKIQKCHMKPEYQALSPDLSMSILISSDSLLRNPRSVGTKRMRCFPALICLLASLEAGFAAVWEAAFLRQR